MRFLLTIAFICSIYHALGQQSRISASKNSVVIGDPIEIKLSIILPSQSKLQISDKWDTLPVVFKNKSGKRILADDKFEISSVTKKSNPTKDSIEWVVLAKVIQHNIQGGELTLHHLYDLLELEELLQHPLACSPFLFEASASKNVGEVCTQSVFFKTNDQLAIRFSDQFASPQNTEEAFFLHRLSDALESSAHRLIYPFPVGQLVLLNNSCWLHGRLKIKNTSTFMRQLLRIRGSFSTTD
jgi:hypothetical protein